MTEHAAIGIYIIYRHRFGSFRAEKLKPMGTGISIGEIFFCFGLFALAVYSFLKDDK